LSTVKDGSKEKVVVITASFICIKQKLPFALFPGNIHSAVRPFHNNQCQKAG